MNWNSILNMVWYVCRISNKKTSTETAALWKTQCWGAKSICGHSKCHRNLWDVLQRKWNSHVRGLFESVCEGAAAADEDCEDGLQNRLARSESAAAERFEEDLRLWMEKRVCSLSLGSASLLSNLSDFAFLQEIHMKKVASWHCGFKYSTWKFSS